MSVPTLRRVLRPLRRHARGWAVLLTAFATFLGLLSLPPVAAAADGGSKGKMPSGPQQRSSQVVGLAHSVAASATSRNKSDGPGGVHIPGKGELGTPPPPAGNGPRTASGTKVQGEGKQAQPPADANRDKSKSAKNAKSAKSGAPATADPGDATPAGQDARSATGLPGTAVDGVEDVAARTATTAVFKHGDGTKTLRVYPRPVHYQKADGTWADIDESLVSQGTDGRWAEKANSAAPTFAAGATDPALVSFVLDGTHSLSYSLKDATPATASVKGSILTYPNAAKATDVVYDAQAVGVKETLILHDASAPTVWTFPLKTTGLTAALDASGNVTFTDATGAVRLTIPHGLMEDSSRNAGADEPAVSSAVTYELVTTGDGQALKMTLDAGWLHAKERVFPVRVDPSSNVNAGTSTFVQYPYTNNYSSSAELKVGTYYDSDARVTYGPANTYLYFPAIGTSVLQNAYIQGVDLNLDEFWAAECKNHQVDVRTIDAPWNPNSSMSYPGVSVDGGSIGSAAFYAGGKACAGALWETIHLGTSPSSTGSQVVNGWAHGAANYGLALTAPTNDNLSWKKFQSATTQWPPYLSINYSDWAASYSTPAQYTMPTATTTGSQQVTLTNAGDTTWTPSNLALKARIYDQWWNEQAVNAPLTWMPSNVGPNGSVTMTGTIPAIKPGTNYQLCWDLYVNGTASLWNTYNVPPQNCTWISASNIPPVLDSVQPPTNQVVNSLAPELHAIGHDPDNWPGSGVSYAFQVFDATGAVIAASGWLSADSWQIPAGLLQWNTSYTYTAAISDTNAASNWSQPAVFTTQIPQPLITSHLVPAADGGGHPFDPQVGNYSASATDASEAVAGPGLAVARAYNSLDPRTRGLFGAGWSSGYDMSLQVDGDASGGVVVTTAAGQTERFGRDDLALTQVTGVGDVTGDGVDDVVAVDRTDGQLYLYRGPDYSGADRQPIVRTWYSADTKTQLPWSTLTGFTGGDITGKKVDDLFAVDPATGKLWEFSGQTGTGWPTCTGTVSCPHWVTADPPGAPFSGIPLQVAATTDWRGMSHLAITPPLSGDGRYDLIAVENSTGYMWAYPINADGTLAARVEIGIGWNWMTQIAGGRFDAANPAASSILGLAGDGALYVYDGKGAGSTLGTSVLNNPVKVAAGGFDQILALTPVNGVGDAVTDFLATDKSTGVQNLHRMNATDHGGTGPATGMDLFTSPAGQGQDLFHQADGSWILRDKTGTSSTFGRQSAAAYPLVFGPAPAAGSPWPVTYPWQLTKIADKNGRVQNLGYTGSQLTTVTDAASGRALHLTWNTAGTHVASVATDPLTPGTATSALTWTYSYNAANPDELDQVCAPPTGANPQPSCTNYGYTTGTTSGSHFRSTVLDAGPSSYWRFGDGNGSSAVSEVGVNQGADNGTYSWVNLGAPGPLPGSPSTSATFNGTSSVVTLPKDTIRNTYLSVGLWFKTAAPGTLLMVQNTPITGAPSHANPMLYVGADNKLYGQLWTGGYSPLVSAGTVTDNAWHFAVLSMAGNTQTLYLDGQAVGTLAGQIQPLDMVYAEFGAGYSVPWPQFPAAKDANGYNHFSGQIAEAAVYGHALGGAAVAQQWAAGTHATTELTGITLPSGKTKFAVVYDAVNDRASKITDANGGNWTLNGSTVVGSAQPYKTAVLASRPQGYWRLSDGGGYEATNSVYVPRPTPDFGTYSNVTLGAPGPFTYVNGAGDQKTTCCSATFDGATSSVELPAGNAPRQGPGAIGLWFKTTAPGVLFSYQSFPLGAPHVQNTDSWNPALYVGTDGKLYGQLYMGNAYTPMVSTAVVNDGKWHFALINATSLNSQTLYLDGAVAAGPLAGSIIPNGISHVYVGAGTADGAWPNHPADPSGHFSGQIANVVLSPKALPAAAIAGLSTPASSDIVTPQQAFDATAMTNNPTGYWKLADTTGSRAVDEVSSAALTAGASGQGDAGTYNATTSGVTGPWASGTTTATSFNGTDSYVKLPSTTAPHWSPASIEVWFKTTAPGVIYSYQSFALGGAHTGGVDKWNPALYVGTDGKLYGELWNGQAGPNNTAVSAVAVNDGKWHMADLVSGSGGQQLYLDGSATGNPVPAATGYNGQQFSYLGAGTCDNAWPNHPADVSGHFNGAIADFAIYRYALDAGTIGLHRAAAVSAATGTGADAASSYRAQIAASGPIGFWRLDDPAGATTARDALGTSLPDPDMAGYSGVGLNNPGPSGSSEATAASFNGSGSYISLPPDALPTSGPASVELWFKTGSPGVLYSYQSGMLDTTGMSNWNPALYVGTDGRLHGLFFDLPTGNSDQMVSPGAVNDNKWHQAVLTGTGTSEALYLDGVQVGSENAGGKLFYNGGPYAYLGAGNVNNGWPNAPTADANGANFFNGLMAEVSYYPASLDAATVAGHFKAMGNAGTPTPVTVTSVGDPGGNTLVYRFDPLNGGRLTMQTDAWGNASRYTYDTGGSLYAITDADQHTVTYGHDARGNIVSTTTCTDPAHCHTSYATYFLNPANPLDPRNDKLLTTSDARSSGPSDATYQTTYSYDLVGDQTGVKLPNGTASSKTYTAGTEAAVGGGTEPPGLLATSVDFAGNTTSYSYYSGGDLATVTTPLGLRTTYTYDKLGRVAGKSVLLTALGGVQTTMATSYAWDGQSDLTSQTDPAVTDAVTGVKHAKQTSYTYDADGNQLTRSVSDTTGGDAARTVTWTYDTHNHVAKVADALGRATTYGYDAFGRVSSSTDPAGTSYGYVTSPMGWLQQVAVSNYTGDPNSPVPARWQIIDSRAYDPAGRLASATDGMGRTTHLYYNDDNTVAEVDLDAFHNADGSLRNVVLETDVYDAAKHVVARTTGGGKSTVTSTYDVNGRLAAKTLDPGGLNRTSAYSYTPNGQLGNVTETGGGLTRQTGYSYDVGGDLINTTVLDGTTPHTTTTAYDQRGLPVSSVSPDGNVTGATAANYTTYYTYDVAGRLTTTTLPPTSVETYNAATRSTSAQQTAATLRTGYDTFGEATSSQDALNNITTTTYDADGEQVAVAAPAYTDPRTGIVAHPVTTTAYDVMGRISGTTVDPAGLNLTTTRTYDQLGHLISVNAPAPATGGKATTTTYTYDVAGERLSMTDPAGAVTQATYDDLGRRITSTALERTPAPQALTTTFQWDDASNLLATTLPGHGTTSSTYDAAGAVSTVTDAARHTATAAYDGLGRQSALTTPDGVKHLTTYNVLDEAVTSADTDTTGAVARTQYQSYDAAGQMTGASSAVAVATDAAAHTTSYTLDALGRVTKQVEPVATGTNITTTFGYDADGRRIRFTNGDGAATYTTYNTLGLTESVIDPATAAFPSAADGTFTSSYDAAGRAVSLTEPGGVLRQRTYDPLGRLTTETATGGDGTTPNRTLGYDADGRVTSAAVPTGTGTAPGTGTETFAYDDRGDLVSAAGPAGNAGYSYDADGNMLTRTDAAGAASFSYNTSDQLTSATDPLTGAKASYTYDAAGRVQNVQYGAIGSRSYGYDTLGRLGSDTVKDPTGATLASIGYGYNLDNRIVSKTTTGTAGAAANTYTYDWAGRLTSWNNGTANTAYTWDAAGNRTAAGSVTATYDARNELLTNGTTSYSYTARGTLSQSTVSGNAPTLVKYDGFDRMTGNGATSYTYDSLDRVAQAGSASFSYNDGSDHLVGDGTSVYSRLPDGSLMGTASVTAGPAGPVLSSPRIVINDLHGDVVATLDATSHAVSGSAAYDPFGKPTAKTGSATSLGYQGGWTDPASGQVDMAARWYQPGTGTFSSRDSWNLNPSPSSDAADRFAYANGDPMDHQDPSGHGICDLVLGPLGWFGRVATGAVAAVCILEPTEMPDDSCEAVYHESCASRWAELHGGSDDSAQTFLCDRHPYLKICGGPGRPSTPGPTGSDDPGGSEGSDGGGHHSRGGGHHRTSPTGNPGIPIRPLLDPKPRNAKPGIKAPDPLDWLATVVTHAGVGLVGAAGTAVEALAPVAVAATAELAIGVGEGIYDLVDDLISDPAPEPEPKPVPYIDPGPGEGGRQDPCAEQNAASSPTNQTGNILYQPLEPYAAADGSIGCRATGAHGTFDNNIKKSGRKAKYAPPGYDPSDPLANSKGHLMGKQFGGSSENPRNFVPQSEATNGGSMSKLEDYVANHFAGMADGESGNYSVVVTYPNNATSIPDYFHLTARSTDGLNVDCTIYNDPSRVPIGRCGPLF